jgi:hypothetical protein
MELGSDILNVVLHKEEVSLAMLEIDGNISVLSDGFKHTSIHKKHINGFLRKVFK